VLFGLFQKKLTPIYYICSPPVIIKSTNTLVLDVEPSDSILSVKETIAERDGIPVDEQRLIYAGLQLEDEATLGDYSIAAMASISMNLRLLGGGKKRKKKVYTKPKKIPHKHKTVKLATLKFYKVDDKTGKITRVRKECHMESCGAGCFMAKHFNRYTCGKCHASYKIQGGKGGE
jgi:small subunit ribosomal protein S27Ae